MEVILKCLIFNCCREVASVKKIEIQDGFFIPKVGEVLYTMITYEVDEKKLRFWKELYEKNFNSLKVNRISGRELNIYFQKKYSAEIYDNEKFKEVVHLNSKEYCYENTGSINDVVAYTLNGDIFIGIDLKTGFFHIESDDVSKSIPIFDDLFITRGLSEDELQNFVIVGQYLELKGL